ncbi:hypothetical protein Lal_00042160 [Lupinus albus]|nr:hypothetical protein Lal_00042160 [Lupinus albus]
MLLAWEKERGATRGLPRRLRLSVPPQESRKTTSTVSSPGMLLAWEKERGATRGLPRRSPILVLLSPKHAYLRSSDGIRCISAGMIAPACVRAIALVLCDRQRLSVPPPESRKTTSSVSSPGMLQAREKERVATRGLPRRLHLSVPPQESRKRTSTVLSPGMLLAWEKERGATRGLPRRSPILVLLSPKHAYLRSSDGIRCISAGSYVGIRRIIYAFGAEYPIPSIVTDYVCQFLPKNPEKQPLLFRVRECSWRGKKREVQHEDFPGGHPS